MTAANIPSEQEALGYFDSLSNWGRWGEDDQMGTLNFLGPDKVKRAVSLGRVDIARLRLYKSEIWGDGALKWRPPTLWIPAFAGMTGQKSAAMARLSSALA